jgi:shikimate kinase
LSVAQPEARLLVFGNFGTGKTTLGKALSEKVLGWPFVELDECRRRFSDGSAAGELAAWSSFLREAEAQGSRILECSGSGPFIFLLRHALRRFESHTMVFWLRAPLTVCMQRKSCRKDKPPYPDFAVSYEAVMADVHRRVEKEIGCPSDWPVSRHVLDATLPPSRILAEATQVVFDWVVQISESPR